MIWTVKSWNNEIIGRFTDEDQAVAAALANSRATKTATKIIHGPEDRVTNYTSVGQLPNGDWVYIPKLISVYDDVYDDDDNEDEDEQ